MHYPAYVLLSKDEATTSLEARQKVMDTLLNDGTFINEYGRFSSPVCDWFVIGGRWTGLLYPQHIRDEFFHQADQLNSGEKRTQWYREGFVQNNRKQLDEIWRKLGGQYANPLARDPYNDLGEEDDARILDNSLTERWNTLLQLGEYIKPEEYYMMSKSPCSTPLVITLDCDVLSEVDDFNDLVGKYWVVVIDYHM